MFPNVKVFVVMLLSRISSFSSRHVRCALGQLKNGIGFDGIHANHLKFTSPIISHILARFINSCFIHNHFPQDMLSGVTKPSIKNKSGNIECSNNYREVMISTIFFKIVEYMMLPFIKKINLRPYQFAYRGDSSTILANSILREILNSNIDGDSTIYSCLLDLSIAFETMQNC